jgi:hypothetical protein
MKIVSQKILKVNRPATYCHEVLVFKDIQEDDVVGVTVQAWHVDDGLNFVQRVFTPMNEDLIPLYIRDFSEESAQEFVELFEI